ncbi:DNA polymerase III subunit epsilon [Pseudoxanthomonas composti]|uniref:DNA polymerase III subunit epsilon n=1 Tax=Pseudoxanthomonas composti TaxID=2137479 RepID=A0A4Q1JWC9_9GAMM|nr:DNA polymerase III subunit epsilon [Pseudoxanthomonas composti]RXR05213.1 DNA polymerase III subunit epsilon [Pseudoxanthomonas composti]
MRQIIFDTETTGLEWKKGNRIVEIGCVEVIERRPTGRTYHQYICPDREFEQGAAEVTGLSVEFLADKPRFAEIADEFLAFIDGAELVIHNAAFDVGFVNYELSLLGADYGTLESRGIGVLDTLALARERFPGQRNSLDALCKRLGVDNAHRQLHGALLDAQILLDVYIGLTTGQEEIGFFADTDGEQAVAKVIHAFTADAITLRRRVQATPGELEAHERRMAVLRKKSGDNCVWDRFA